jgi:hypothetical protein
MDETFERALKAKHDQLEATRGALTRAKAHHAWVANHREDEAAVWS